MTRRMGIFIAAILFFTGLVVIANAAPSNAVSGCRSKVVLKGDNWSNDVLWSVPSSRIPKFKKIRLTATTAYWYCPNGKKPNKIQPKWVNFCWTHLDGENIWFDGVKFNPYYFDDIYDTNPVQTKVEDDGSVQNCEVLDIIRSQEVWLKMGNSPGWTVSSWIVRHGVPDEHWDFRVNMKDKKSTVRYFHPSEDVNLGDWHK